VRAVDIMPTVLGLAGAKPIDTQGVDLSKALAGAAEAPSLSPYSESLHPKLEFGMSPLHGIRADDWTYIRAPRPELYDRSKDPGERRNLLEDADPGVSTEATAQALSLDARVSEVFEDSKRFGLVSDVKPLDAETVEMLKALGYMSESDTPKGVDGMDPKDGNQAFNELDQARQLVLGKDYAAARTSLRGLIERVPGSAFARNLLAECETRLGNFEVVEGLYLQSLALEPRQPEVIVHLGRFRLLEGKQDAARARFVQALEVDPAYIEAMMLLAYLERQQGRPEEAMRWYDKAIEIDPGDPAPYLQYGDHYFRQNDFKQAQRWYEKSLQVQPDNFVAAMQAGTSAMRLGESTTAEGYFARANRIDPTSWKPFFNLACTRVLAGDANEAVEYLQNAATLGFDNVDLLQADPCLAPLVADPRFGELVRQLGRR
jgi:Flp pilus assembly protein TadD